MFKISIKIASLVALSSILVSCGDSTQQETALIEENTSSDATETVETDLNQSEILLPSPLQIAELFKTSGLSYVGDLTNSHEKIGQYNSKYDLKLNFGIYAADMAYCIMNNQTQESINSLATLKKLSEKLWMTDIMGSMGLSHRLEANVGNEDSLSYIMADLQMQMDDYLDENGMSYTGAVIFTGAWIETMYLGAKVNESKTNPKLISRLSEQALILKNLITAVKQNNEDGEFSDLITDLEKINIHFAGYYDENVEEFILSDEAIKNLTTDLTAVRTKIVG
jgi:hypothetical protein